MIASKALGRHADLRAAVQADGPVPRVRARTRSVVAGLGSAVVHAALMLFAVFTGSGLASRREAPPIVTQMFEVELDQAMTAEPERPAEPEQQPTPPMPVARARPPRETAKPAAQEAPPPVAAQAAQALTANEDVVDFGETIVVGNAATYAGGVTQAGGTSERAVRDTNARAGGTPGGTGTQLAADLTRAPQLAGGADWDCPFPVEADDDSVDHAVVALEVVVSAEGRVLRVRVARDPGHGFGHEARRCALGKRWAPGTDRAGKPTPAVALINVRFDR